MTTEPEQKPNQTNIEEQTKARNEALQENAKIAYEEVPTQEEMLNGGKPVPAKPPAQKADEQLTRDLNDSLYDAAQRGNIGGG